MKTRKIVIGALVVAVGLPVVLVVVAVVSFYVSFYDPNRANVLYTIQGGGHTWPGGKSMLEWFLGRTSRSIDASSQMWAFFREHRLVRN